MKFKHGDVVEQTNIGDLPFRVMKAKKGSVNRYRLEGIDGSSYENIPEYMMVTARPPSDSRWWQK